ncbi:hypothetical protein [Streptomyces sp. ADI98-10]|uniref:hypothetical protein n=1 Tax=Streptomyces sp. ADI98-10 TaxID=1522763 RepID=UPI000F558071|nr:hypothetical protein [Streptomyces sp. ADI98-10]RPK78197.1 hypothetical protein EES46_34430 [Streptomyces sp. ADI98-10]
MTRTRGKKPSVEPGLIPAPGGLLDWRDASHFDRWQDHPCALCGHPTPMRSHAGEPVHKCCAESWIAANPVEARQGRFASDSQPKSRHEDNHA